MEKTQKTQKHMFDPFTEKQINGYYEEPKKQTPIIHNVDVLVVGGSQTGVTAAIAAARHGSKVMIVERFGFLGGQSIYSMVVQWEKRAFINNLGAVLTKGIPKEIKDRVVNKGDSDGLWETPPGCPEMRGGEEHLDPESIKVTLMEMCQEENIKLLFHTLAVDVILHSPSELSEPSQPPQPKRLKGVIFENKTGRFAITAKVIIDATADLDLIWRAIDEEGCGIRSPSKRMTSCFYTWYAGIDNERFIDWYLNNPNAKGVYPDPKKYPEKVRKHLKEGKEIKIGGSLFQEIMEKAEEKGLMEKIEDIMAEAEVWGMVSLEMKWVGFDRWSPAFVNINNMNMLDAWQLTKMEIFRQKLDYYMLPILRMIPGWEKAYISRETLYLGSRETRWLKATKMIDQNHIWNQEHAKNPTPPDAIGRSGGHDPCKNKVKAGYPIPYGILIPEKIDGVIVCARSVGTNPDKALDAHRGIVPSMVTGQGAGTAAALSIIDGVQPRGLDIKKLQKTLREDGVQLDHETVEFECNL